MTIAVLDKDGSPQTISTIDELLAVMGEVQATPTSNTLLARVKAAVDLLATIDADTGALTAAADGNDKLGVVIHDTSGNGVDPVSPSTPWHNRDWTTDSTEVQVGTGAKTLHWLWAANMTASVAYLQVFNLAPASVTLGTTAPLMVFPVPTLGDTNGAGFSVELGAAGTLFDTALTVAMTTTATGATAVADNGVFLNLGYS